MAGYVATVLGSLFVLVVGTAHSAQKTQISEINDVVERRVRHGSVETRHLDESLRSRPTAGSNLSRTQVKSIVEDNAGRFGIEAPLVHAIIAAESGYDTRAVSRAGALGVMQIMPETAKDYGVIDPKELFDPRVNIRVGVRHLRRLLEKYDDDYGTAVMAYNAGEGAVDRTSGRVSFRETLDYVEAVIENYRGLGGRRSTDGALRKIAMLRNPGHIDPAQSLSIESPKKSATRAPSRRSDPIRHIRTVRQDMSPKTLARFGFRSPGGDNSPIRSTFRRIR